MCPADSIGPDTEATSRARNAAREAFAYTGLDVGDVHAAVIAGGVTPELLLAVAELLPPPRPILLLDTFDSLVDLERRAQSDAVPSALAERCTTVVLSGRPAPLCLPTYLATWEFLMANDLRPANVALCGTGHSAEEPLLQQAYRAALDILLCHSSQFVASVERSRLPVSQVIDWALFVARHGSPLHALELLHALRPALPRATLAPPIVQLWVSLGCPEPALAWLDALEPEQRRQCEQPLRRAVAARKEVLQEMLEQNLAGLARVAAIVPEPVGGDRTVHVLLLPDVAWRPAPGGGARRERYPCLIRIAGERLVELSPPGHPRALFETLNKPYHRHDGAALIGSLASPTLFQLISELPPFAGVPDLKRKIYVIEEDPDVVQAFLSTLSLEPLLAEERFEFLLGPGATQRFEQKLRENPLLPLPGLVLDTRREQVEALVRVRDQRGRRVNELVAELAERYTRERLAELPRLLGARPPRRAKILVYTSFFTTVLKYQARDMVAALESLGYDVRLLHEGHGTHLMTRQVILETVDDFDPDLFYCLDVIRPALGGLPERLPVVCWIQDELPRLSNHENIVGIGPVDFTFCLSAEWTRRYRDLGYPHTAHLSMAADPKLYAPPEGGVEADPDSRAPSVPEIVMITHVQRPVEAIPGLFAQLEPILRDAIKMRARLSEYDPEIRAAAAVLGVELEPSRLDEARLNVHLLARHVELTTVARWLVEAGLDVGLYGSGWSELPDLACYARGALSSGRELSAVYSRAKVVLHINGTMNCHVRVFECLAAGGLPLCRSHATDYSPGELNDALRIGKEVLCFDGRRDLLEKLGHLLGDDAYRQRIVQGGRRRVLDEHCMKHRMQRTLDEIRQVLSASEAVTGPHPRGSECPAPDARRDVALA